MSAAKPRVVKTVEGTDPAALAARSRRGDNFFDGVWVGVVLGMASVFCLFAVMAAAGVYGG